MDKKLIFFDIDGTLITEDMDPYVPDSTWKALEMLRQNGHICIINTGRPYAGLDTMIRSIPVDGYVCGCGTYIRLGEETLLYHQLPQELCTEIIYELDRCRLEFMLESRDGMFIVEKEYISNVATLIDPFRAKVPERFRCITEADYTSVRFDKFVFMTEPNSDFERFFEKFQDRLTFIDRGNTMYEVIPKAYSKATGMKFLEDYFAIAHKDTMAVGDSTNDIPMLSYASESILMGGADPKLQEYATYVTTPIKEDGIYAAFKHFGLI